MIINGVEKIIAIIVWDTLIIKSDEINTSSKWFWFVQDKVLLEEPARFLFPLGLRLRLVKCICCQNTLRPSRNKYNLFWYMLTLEI